jgi:hypothetical protein
LGFSLTRSYTNIKNIEFSQTQFRAKLLINKKQFEEVIHDIYVDMNDKDLEALYERIDDDLKMELEEHEGLNGQMDNKLTRLDIYPILHIVPLAGVNEILQLIQIMKLDTFDPLKLLAESIGLEEEDYIKFMKVVEKRPETFNEMNEMGKKRKQEHIDGESNETSTDDKTKTSTDDKSENLNKEEKTDNVPKKKQKK